MRWFILTFLAAITLHSVQGWSETVEVTGSSGLVLKHVEKVGNRIRAQIIDHDGRESQIYINSDDAVEFKRGLWVIRPGIYQLASR